MNDILLKTMIYSALRTSSDKVFHANKPQTAVRFPYVVFNLERSDTDENQKMENYELTVSIYGADQFDSTDIDTLAGTIDGDGHITSATGTHRKHYRSSNLTADIYRTSRITDGDGIVQWVELTYDVFAYLT